MYLPAILPGRYFAFYLVDARYFYILANTEAFFPGMWLRDLEIVCPYQPLLLSFAMWE